MTDREARALAPYLHGTLCVGIFDTDGEPYNIFRG
ncbi:hypothetical protein DR64_4694 [Paraburkholderia xenovorans LB400]|nr:hypothetical protein DR64_4694 [Paraburkholderia xenovorans LB400]